MVVQVVQEKNEQRKKIGHYVDVGTFSTWHIMFSDPSITVGLFSLVLIPFMNDRPFKSGSASSWLADDLSFVPV
jgi:sugar phosphate permease